MDHDQLGNMTAKTFGNGVVQAYAFDAVSRLQSLTSNLSGGSNDLTATFAMSPASQIKSTTRTGDAYPYTGFTALTRDYVVNGLNQYTSSVKSGVTTTYTYDSKGNLTNDGTSGFTYSSENLLKSGPNSSALTYDPMMRLFQVSGAATTRFGYDGLNMAAEYNGSNALQRRYVFAPGLDAPIVWYEGTGTTDRRFLSADERGSIIAASDTYSFKLSTNGYDEYGVPQSPASAGAGTSGVGTVYGRFGYTGQAWIPEVGLYYYKARFYSPTFGRFMQTDPIGYANQANLYAYVGNDPVNWVDPLGLQTTDNQEPIYIDGCNVKYPPPACSLPGAIGAAAASVGGSGEGSDQFEEIIITAARLPQSNCPTPARLSSLDGFINLASTAYNFGRGFGAPAAEALPSDLVQAMVAVESGYNASAYASDPMQVNNAGDWTPRKADFGLTKGVAPGQYLGIVAGIQWLSYKAYRYDSTGARSSFRGWGEAVTRYNGGGDPNYLSKVQAARASIGQGC